jgi:hypothetical protein
MSHEAANTSETSVKFYQTTRRNNPEDSNFHTRRRENLKSQVMSLVFTIFFQKKSNFVKTEMNNYRLARLTSFKQRLVKTCSLFFTLNELYCNAEQRPAHHTDCSVKDSK